MTRRELILSRALRRPDSPLHALADDLASNFDFVLVKDTHREARLKDIADSLAEGTITFPDLEVLLQVADIGVEKVDIEETDLPRQMRRALRRFMREIRERSTKSMTVTMTRTRTNWMKTSSRRWPDGSGSLTADR